MAHNAAVDADRLDVVKYAMFGAGPAKLPIKDAVDQVVERIIARRDRYYRAIENVVHLLENGDVDGAKRVAMEAMES